MEGSFALSGISEMMSELLQLRNLDLSLLLIQRIKTLSLKLMLVACHKLFPRRQCVDFLGVL